jgi:hypothetical protein
MKGVTCKDLGENLFLFTFTQAAGKRRVLEDGPWMFGKDLVVMADFDESKSIEELKFIYIPVWVRVSKLPLGMMNKAVGEAIGGEMGEFVEMEKEEDVSAVGRFLRVKIRWDIRKPLMRGVMVQAEGKEGKPRPLWCPVAYEYLPDFCYTCGLIGHIDKECSRELKKGDVQQYNKALRVIPERRRWEDGAGDRGWQSRPSWRQGGSGSKGSWGSGGKGMNRTGSGSDAPSWRKSEASEGSLKLKERGEEEEVTSPEKKQEKSRFVVEKTKRTLDLGGQDDAVKEGEKAAMKINVNSGMQPMHVEPQKGLVGDQGLVGEKCEAKKKGTFKRIPRVKVTEGGEKQSKESGSKRALGEINMEEEMIASELKEQEVAEVPNKRAKKAGLADQPCKSQ